MKRQYLRKARKDKGYTIRETARRLDIAPSTYHGFEVGGESISMKRALALIHVLNIDPLYFFEEENRYLSETGQLKLPIA